VLTRRQPVSAGPSITAGGSLIAIALMVVGVDQLSKHLATAALSNYPDGGPTFAGGWLTLTYTTNTGAAFGVLADRGVLFLLIGIVVLCVAVAYWRFLPSRNPLLRISLGLQLGGACGNLLDRVRYGYVVDFIEVRYWPVFNVADASIVVGVLILIYYLLVQPPAPAAQKRDDARDEER
jgi:signal peptidase II